MNARTELDQEIKERRGEIQKQESMYLFCNVYQLNIKSVIINKF